MRKRRTDYKITHGLSRTRIYTLWSSMKRRCYTTSDTNFRFYGKRGIEVCKAWRNADGFMNFYQWSMENGYKDNLSIDRLSNDGDYSPTNCRWVPILLNRRHQRSFKLSMEKAKEIRNLSQQGIRNIPLSKLYQVTPTTISYVLRNYIWT